MVVFVVLLFAPMLFQHVIIGRKNIDYEKKNKRALLLFFLMLTALVALRREDVGTDTGNYIHLFENYSTMTWRDVENVSLELGFSYFNKIVLIFTKEPQLFLAVMAIVTIAMMYPTYKRLCEDASLTIVLFCIMSTFVVMFSGIRQMLAVGIGFIAYEFTRKNKLIPFILMVFLAMTFHTSAFMLAFMYPIYHAKITKKWLLVVIPSLVVMFAFNKQIFFSLSFLLEQYTQYEANVSSTGAYTMIILFVMFAVFAFLIPDETKIDSETIGLRNFLLFSIVIQMFAPLHSLSMRMNYYYIVFIPLLLPKIIKYKSERYKQVAVVARHVMVIFFFIYFFINASVGGGLRVFPYHFFWEAMQ